MSDFQFIAITFPDLPDPGTVIAASRAGGVGILNLEIPCDLDSARIAITRIAQEARGECGVKLSSEPPEFATRVLSELPDQLQWVILDPADGQHLEALIEAAGGTRRRILLESTCMEHAALGVELSVSGLIAKGSEAGGRVGEETGYVLLQRLLKAFDLPVFAQGGIGLHTAAACYVAGAAGVVLDSQLALTSESRLPQTVKRLVARMEDEQTIYLGGRLGQPFRVYKTLTSEALSGLTALEEALSLEPPGRARDRRWNEAIGALLGWDDAESKLMPLGQDAVFAAPLSRRFRTVGGVLRGLRDSIKSHLRDARTSRSLARDAPLAKAHGTAYPILQGPMTRVSDTAAFVEAVAREGALPFLALAMLRAPQVRQLLAETQQSMAGRPWGVGILGFVTPELRQEQLQVLREFSPPFALIAGGRPDQVKVMEQEGIATYIHVPAPSLLRLFLDDGVRRFVFEGRECGGHVGPRTSFMLWSSAVDVLLEAMDNGIPGEQLYVIFAGGIHDACSAAMAASIAAPLTERDVRWGVLMGSSYLFTSEAVTTDAIVEEFQNTALNCDQTVLLETAPGHVIRCANTPYYRMFQEKKRQLVQEGRPADAIRDILDEANLGRLRIASKGIARRPESEQGDGKGRYVEYSSEQQRVDGMYMLGQVATLHSHVLKIADLHREVAEGGAAFLLRVSTPFEQEDECGEETPAGCDIAIIGIGCLLPGAHDVTELWQNIIHKVDVIREVPEDRWGADLYFDPDRSAQDKVYSKWGGFLDDVPFNPLQYGIPPKALPSIDPLQLLTLEVVGQALDDAGYRDGGSSRDKTSFILGASGGLGDLGMRYSFRANMPQYGCTLDPAAQAQLPTWTEDSFAGILLNVAAGRVANRFDFGGVNFVVDAACASSLAALHLGVRELASGTSDMVIVGGADTVQSPFGYLCFSKTKALSTRAYCSTFDEHSDGTIISEGLVALVLKRLADAEKDGDQVYAVVKSVAGSSDGRDKGLTAPRPKGQRRAMERAYRQAGISPSTVGLVEAHGTGTVVGDGVEVAALSKVFNQAEAKNRRCALGSIKSMLGHTKAAAGLAGVTKAALALHNKVLPPTLNVTKPNPRIEEPDCPFFVNTEPAPWIGNNGQPRRAGVSAFGFGGANFHAVLEEYTGSYRESSDRASWRSEILFWRASAPKVLLDAMEGLKAQLDGDTSHTLGELAAQVSQSRRSHERVEDALNLAIVTTSISDLRSKLDLICEHLSAGDITWLAHAPGIYVAPVSKSGPRGKLAILFPGQGSQYPFMLGDMGLHFAPIRESLERADRVLADHFPKPLSAYVYPPRPFTADQESRLKRELTDTVIAQPALGAVEVGLYRILTGIGVKPDMVAGHSYGEYVALWAAGVLSEDALIKISEARGRSIKEMTGDSPGGMLAVNTDKEHLSKVLDGRFEIWLANMNSPRQSILAGRTEELEKAAAMLQSEGFAARPIPVACAFHSPLMEPARTTLQKHLDSLTFSPPRVQVFSNAGAQPYPAAISEFPEILSQHLVQPLRFTEQIEAMYREGARVFLEVGPRTVLTGLVKTILANKDAVAIAVDVSDREGPEKLQHVAAQLAVLGFPVNLWGGYKKAREGANAAPVSPSAWWVNGTRARPPGSDPANQAIESRAAAGIEPAAGDRQPPLHDAITGTIDGASAIDEIRSEGSKARRPNGGTRLNQGAGQVETPSAEKRATEITTRPPIMADNEQSEAKVEELEQVMLGFQQLMSQFLDVQKSVMTSLLEGGMPAAGGMALPAREPGYPAPAGVQSASSLPREIPQPEMVEPARIANSAGPQQPVTPDSGSGDIEKPDPARQLLELVSERTGYPMEMLGLEADLEADLGIDSIKRVEILTALRKRYAAAEQAQIQEVMDQLTSAKTLGQVLELLGEVLAAPRAASGPAETAEGQALASGNSAADDPAAQLLSIVVELTGYPLEMLDLDASLEADLGIDSIKRVEVLTAVQRCYSGQAQASIQANMDALTAAKTLGQIVAILDGFLQPSAVQPPSSSAGNQAAVDAQETPLDSTGVLLSIVAERTGYPPEMLDLDAGIEADLGIDSIKRVEILSAFQRVCSEEDQNSLSKILDALAAKKTLGEMATAVSKALSGGAMDAASPPLQQEAEGRSEPSVSKEAGTVPGYTLAAVEIEPLPELTEAVPDRLWVVTDDEQGIAVRLLEVLQAKGARGVLVRQRQALSHTSSGVFEADLSRPESVGQLLDQIRKECGPIGAVLHLLPLREGSSIDQSDLAGWRQRVQRDLKSLYSLARYAGEGLLSTEGKSLFAAVTGRGGLMGCEAVPAQAATHGGVASFIKTLAVEWPEVNCKVVDLDLTEPVAGLTDKLIVELHQDDGRVEVGYRDDRRLACVARLDTAREPAQIPPAELAGPDWVFLLTGGARGITAEIAKYLAVNYRPTLILAGLSPLQESEEAEGTRGLTDPGELKAAIIADLKTDDGLPRPQAVERAYQQLLRNREIIKNITELQDLGATVEYHQLDVRDGEAFGGLLDRIYLRHDRLDAVVHGAGIIEDKLVLDKEPDSFDRVLHTKVDSAFVLSNRLKPEGLKRLVFMSSVSGTFGNRGQSDYAAANGILNGIAAILSTRWPGRILSINWGPWDKKGMASGEVREQLMARGMQFIAPAAGAEAFGKELRLTDRKRTLVVMGDGPWPGKDVGPDR